MGQGIGQKDEGVGLYSTGSAVYPIDSPVKKRILSMLEVEGPLSFDEIAGRLGKAKSTVSVHLKGLAGDGVIEVQTNPDDARRKTFHLSGRHVGTLSAHGCAPPRTSSSAPAAEFADIPSLYRFMCCQVRTAMMEAGINIEPILYSAGKMVGTSIAGILSQGDMNASCGALANFWRDYGLGTITFESLVPLVIITTDCFECGDLPYVGRPVCAFEKGVFSSVFSSFYGQNVTVAETRCCAMGDDMCRFVITPGDRKSP
ncbi:MAG TPA: MarR family transcriptional regulator [Methanoculleus sp.]|nr:MarR family transcriptional regulator [Methanoculleus sp.]